MPLQPRWLKAGHTIDAHGLAWNAQLMLRGLVHGLQREAPYRRALLQVIEATIDLGLLVQHIRSLDGDTSATAPRCVPAPNASRS